MKIWKDIKDHKGYRVSSDGKIRSWRTPELKTRINKYGYEVVLLHGNKHCLVHRLIAIAFIQNPEKKPCINHKNGIKHDNRIGNLEWVTYSENMIHSFALGLQVVGSGDQNHLSKAVNQYTFDGYFLKRYGSQREAAKENGFIGSGNISAACKGKLKVAYGYKWEYA